MFSSEKTEVFQEPILTKKPRKTRWVAAILLFSGYKTTEQIIFSLHISFFSVYFISSSIYFSKVSHKYILQECAKLFKMTIKTSNNSVFTITLYIFKHWYGVVILDFERVNAFVLLKISINFISISAPVFAVFFFFFWKRGGGLKFPNVNYSNDIVENLCTRKFSKDNFFS